MPGFIQHSGVRTAFEVIGTGPALLMLHGAEGSRRQFAGIRQTLSDRFTVISYDQRDCGETTNPDSPARLIDLADDAVALLQAIGHPRAHVFGTSFGGRVAQALALRHADHVDRLILASTWPLAVSLASANAQVATELARLRQQLPASAEQLAEYFFPASFLATHPASRQHFKAAQARSPRTERRTTTVNDQPDLDVARIKHTTLLIAGAEDRVVPAALTLSLSALIRDSRSVVLPEVGHLSLAQAPADVDRLLRDFLA